MKVLSCKINNYKSICEEKNIIYINDLTIILGKNESGKSNIIDAISGIRTIGYTDEAYFKNRNRNNNKSISIELTLKSTETDLNLSDYKEEINLCIENDDVCKIDENFGNYILNKENIKISYDEIIKFIEEENLPINKPENKKYYEIILNKLSNIKSELFILPAGTSDFEKRLRLTGNKNLIKFCEMFRHIESLFEEVYCDFPLFISLSNQSLKTTYSLSEYDKEIEDDYHSILYQFLNLVKIDVKELKNVLSSNDMSYIVNKQNEYNGMIKEKFVNIFNQFYSQELIDLQFIINFNTLNILIKTNGAYLEYTERSRGLQWYLNMFIQLLFNSQSRLVNNILLLDEPGVFLHPLAQKELASLLNDLSQKGNQIVYTTHSPFMINYNELQNIRAVEKDDNGNSLIYNKITEFPRKSKNKYETLTPLINAIGYNMSMGMGPNYENKNIIVEGISDYFYLSSYIKLIGLNKYNIIASVGADNITAIASILYGWGCDFVVLLDQDVKGRSVYDKIKGTSQPYLDKVIFADGKEYNKKEKFEIENIFEEKDKKNLGINSKDYNDNKYYYSMTCYELIKNGEYDFGDNTKNNFKEIFDKFER